MNNINKDLEQLKILEERWKEMMDIIYKAYWFSKATEGDIGAFSKLLCCLSKTTRKTTPGILEKEFQNYGSKAYKGDINKFKQLQREVKRGLELFSTKYSIINTPTIFEKSRITSPGDVAGNRFLKDLSIINDLATHSPTYPDIKDIRSDDKAMREFFENTIYQLENEWLEIKQRKFLTEEGIRLQCPCGHFIGRFTNEMVGEANKEGGKVFHCRGCEGILQVSIEESDIIFRHILKKEIFDKLLKKINGFQPVDKTTLLT